MRLTQTRSDSRTPWSSSIPVNKGIGSRRQFRTKLGPKAASGPCSSERRLHIQSYKGKCDRATNEWSLGSVANSV
ncbi:hypothetical protein KC349_g295 [Hortaea werneckii]|nr:hypothetical protein KC349_g295 [Hortaea werneckii]